MRYIEVPQFVSDPEVFRLRDTHTALRFQQQYIEKHAPQRAWPLFFEVDRTQGVDPVLHSPLAARTLFTQRSPMQIAAINQFVKPDWRLTLIGRIANRRDNFTINHLTLKDLDYFPSGGDEISWNGYRYTILSAVPPPEAYWHQTGVWLHLVVEAIVAPQGDARPVSNPSIVLPVEQSPHPTAPFYGQ